MARPGRLPILEKLKQDGYPEMEKYVVTMPAYLQKLNKLYTEENLPLLKDYLIDDRLLQQYAPLGRAGLL